MGVAKRIAFLFPGQGSQHPGMGKDFFEAYPVCLETFQEADDILKRKLSSIIFEGPESLLTETRNSQTAIYVMSMAILRLVQTEFPEISPYVAAGLSLGEYTALSASQRISFAECLPLVQLRGELMNEACEKTKGTMAVILGLEPDVVEAFVKELQLPNDLWVANFNCPGQVVISGTSLGIEKGSIMAKEKGAKRIMPLQVHGAFHSGLMSLARDRLKEKIDQVPLQDSCIPIVMNTSGDFETDERRIRTLLVDQVTHSVRWQQGVCSMENHAIDLYLEMGPGKTLAGMNKRIGVKAPTISIEKIEDLSQLEEFA
ncbi:MAG: ACP S-malonyltransferase [Chlamydiales bacterium]|nr:ACP S-malonyltransferase [Chlamydiales bacterium]